MEWIWVGLGGACGAVCRFAIGRWIATKWKGAFPMGTWLVNVTGSFLFGWLLPFTAVTGNAFMSFVATGMLGAYTTFSTFSVEAVRLWEHHLRNKAYFYVTVSLLTGLAAAGLGWWLGTVALPLFE